MGKPSKKQRKIEWKRKHGQSKRIELLWNYTKTQQNSLIKEKERKDEINQNMGLKYNNKCIWMAAPK